MIDQNKDKLPTNNSSPGSPSPGSPSPGGPSPGGPSPGGPSPGGFPVLVMAGGMPSNPDATTNALSTVFQDFAKPTVAYIGTANGDSRPFFMMMKHLLSKAGAGKVELVRLAKAKVDVSAAKLMLDKADVIFFSGGEVEDGIIWLKRHELIEYLHELYTSGKRFIGVSAGTIMLGSHWVHWDVEGDDDTSSLFDCLGIVPLLFDTHGESEDWVELKAALKLLGHGSKGYALPSGCAVYADAVGNLTNLSKEPIVYANNNGLIQVLDQPGIIPG
ncbi:MAG: Type 1 glutamine amidotransferase-like domain-containing protein [Coriobacteriales bacterium]|jgi:peptidase E|nr:Type 1 glutamine amidotransferase-like domain-containing protein [Coriobacteriales bacterium]